MKTENRFSIIVPAFNEEATIVNFVKNLKEALKDSEENYEIIVVDDGSTDNTYTIAREIPGIKVVNHPYNKGNGAAVKTGIQESQSEYIVIIDADGQHDPKHIPGMIRLLGEYDLIVGARDTFGMGRRGFGNIFVSKLASYLSGITIPDLTCGFRAFKKDKMMEFIDLLPNGYSLPSTSTLAFATTGYNIKFIPISADTRQGGASKIKVSKDGVKFLILIVRMISLFKPLKVFAPVSIFLFSLSFLWSIRTFLYSYQLTSTVAMLFLAGIFTFLIGLIADQISEVRLSIGKINKRLMKKENDQ